MALDAIPTNLVCKKLAARPRSIGGFRFCLLVVWLAGIVLGGANRQAAAAENLCDTPVYRYAMYRWRPAPYELYLFHDRAIHADQQEVLSEAAKCSENKESPLNIVALPIDLVADKDLLGVPPDVKQAWEGNPKKTPPKFMVTTPRGGHIYTGPMTKEEIAVLADSPARRQMAKLLEDGCAGVMVLLTSPVLSEEAKQRHRIRTMAAVVLEGRLDAHLLLDDISPPSDQLAEQEAKAFIADVQSGKLKLNSALGPGADPGAADEEPVRHRIGFVKVHRDSKEEKWFVRSLLTAEPGLQKDTATMVFTIYGRGRALPPFIGRGITRDNLAESIEFITGACSCTVKEQNPGVDLLISYDWEKAAAALAERFGAEEGNESQMGADQFFPELIVPNAGEINSPPTSESSPTGDKNEKATEDVAAAADSQSPSSEDPGNTVASKSLKNETSESKEMAARSNPPRNGAVEEKREGGGLGLWTIAGGMIVAMFVLLGATFFVLRPNRK